MSYDNFEQREKNIDKLTEQYYDKYRDYMDVLESKSVMSNINRLEKRHYFELGAQLARFDEYVNEVINENGTAADLGKLPDIGLDVITAGYSTSVAPIISSIQPISEEQDTIYFKNVQALHTKGNVSANQTLFTPENAPDVYADGYASEITTSVLITTVSGTLSYSGSLSNPPVRPYTFYVEVPLTAGVIRGRDMGDGTFAGVGVQGSIDYNTGAWTLRFLDDPSEAVDIKVMYGTDYEAGADLPKINTKYTSAMVRAEVFTLASDLGILKKFAMKNRFGVMAEEEDLKDLTEALTSEIGNALVATLIQALPITRYPDASIDWSKDNTVLGISWNDHKIELLDVIARRDSQLVNQAGQGNVNLLIAGPSAAGYLRNMPGFVSVNVRTSGPAVYGTLNDMVVVRAPQVATDDIYCIYKGSGSFDTPLVYAPLMPLMLKTVQSPNPLKQTSYAAVWAARKAVIPAYITRVRIVN